MGAGLRPRARSLAGNDGFRDMGTPRSDRYRRRGRRQLGDRRSFSSGLAGTSRPADRTMDRWRGGGRRGRDGSRVRSRRCSSDRSRERLDAPTGLPWLPSEFADAMWRCTGVCSARASDARQPRRRGAPGAGVDDSRSARACVSVDCLAAWCGRSAADHRARGSATTEHRVMMPLSRLQRVRDILLAGVAIRALGYGTAVALAVIVSGALVDMAVAISLPVRQATTALAVAAGFVTASFFAWRDRHARSIERVALWVEERDPSLQFALVTAVSSGALMIERSPIVGDDWTRVAWLRSARA